MAGRLLGGGGGDVGNARGGDLAADPAGDEGSAAAASAGAVTGAKNTMMVAWIQNQNNTFVLQNASLPVAQRRQVLPIAGVVLDVATLAAPLRDGSYTVAFHDTANGHPLQRAVVACPGAGCKATVPTFVGDIAVLVAAAWYVRLIVI